MLGIGTNMRSEGVLQNVPLATYNTHPDNALYKEVFKFKQTSDDEHLSRFIVYALFQSPEFLSCRDGGTGSIEYPISTTKFTLNHAAHLKWTIVRPIPRITSQGLDLDLPYNFFSFQT